MYSNGMLDNIDADKIKDQALNSLRNIFKETAIYFDIKYKVLIYNLVKKGHIQIETLAKDAGLSGTRIYQIVDEVEKFFQEKI